MQEISTFVILKATNTDRQPRRLRIFKILHLFASDNTLIILVYSDQMTSDVRTQTFCAWAACGSSQSEEWTMVFTREKNDTSNQNGERCFFTCEKNDTSNQKPQRCEFRAKIPAFSCSLLSAASHTFKKKSFSQRVFFSWKKWKTFQKWSGIVSFVSLSI